MEPSIIFARIKDILLTIGGIAAAAELGLSYEDDRTCGRKARNRRQAGGRRNGEAS